MDKSIWVDHLNSWQRFLEQMASLTVDERQRIRLERQLNTIEQVRNAAVLNPVVLAQFISPTAVSADEYPCDEFFFDLNESQKKAVRHALGNNCLTLIQGPPGTGKTQVIAEVCLQLHKRNPQVRILVCSETHVAVNNLVSRIAKENKEIRIVRIRDYEKDSSIDAFAPEIILNAYLSWASANIVNKDAFDIIASGLSNPEDKSLEKALALSANVVGMTCNRVSAYNFRDRTEMFDYVIIDEVCKATLPDILGPMLIAEKAILIGDPKQLPPVFCAEERAVIQNIENCNLINYLYIDRLFKISKHVILLNTQYRMSKQIAALISDLFYREEGIKDGRNQATKSALTWIDYNPSQKWPDPNEENKDSPEIYNSDECEIISKQVESILAIWNTETCDTETCDTETKIAVIAPYKAQVDMLRKVIKESNQVKIDSVDGFQGKQSHVVIFSITRTYGPFRFLADYRRLNVALSRAKDRIVIVGNSEYSDQNRLLFAIRRRCEYLKY